MSDDVMPDSFEWPSQAEMHDDNAFRLWLIKALSHIHGKVGALDRRVATVERIVYAAAGIIGTSVFFAIVKLVVK